MRCVYPVEALRASCSATATPDSQAIPEAQAASSSSITAEMRSSRETALASKLTGFRSGDYSFLGDESGRNEHRWNVRGGCDQCEWWAGSEGACSAACGVREPGFDPANLHQYPRTVARTSAIRQRPAPGRRPRRLRARRRSSPSLPSASRAAGTTGFRCVSRGRGARRNKESVPWPRASGPSSPTTAVGPGCMGFGCGCVRALVAPSSRAGVARAGAR